MNDFNSMDPNTVAHVGAAAAGGFVAAWKAAVPGTTFAARCVHGVSGALFAYYCSQLLAWWTGIQHAGAIGGIAFLLGLLGMALTDAALKGIAETKVGDLFNGALRRVLRLGAKGEAQ